MTTGTTGPDSVRHRSVPPAATPAVELIDITKTFPGVVANDHVSLAAMRGEVLCLLGENGAGKSTLMSILSGIYRPDEGRILVDGRAVTIESPCHSRDLGIGMVYQHLSLIPTLTVLENLMMGANPGLTLDRDQARRRFGELAASLGVSSIRRFAPVRCPSANSSRSRSSKRSGRALASSSSMSRPRCSRHRGSRSSRPSSRA